MEKWQLAGIISNCSKPALILPADKPKRTSQSPKRSEGPNKLTTLLQSAVQKITEVIAFF